MADKKALTIREYAAAIKEIAALSARTAPIAVFFKVVSAVTDAVLPLVTTYFAALTTTALASAYGGDEASGQRALLYVGITAALGLATMVWSSVDQYVQSIMRYKIGAKVSDMMYEKFHRLDFWQYDDKKIADLYDKAQRFSQFYAYVFDGIAGIASSIIGLVTALVALVVVVPWIGLVVMISVIPGVYLQFKLSRVQINHWNKNVESRRARSYIEWNLLQPNTIPELRLSGLIKHLLNLRTKYREKDERETLRFERKYMPKRLVADGFQSIAELVALVWVVIEIINRNQPIGQFIYVQQIVSRTMGSVNSLVSRLSTIDEDLANLGDYQKFMSLPEQGAGGQLLGQTPGRVTFENVSFTYPETKTEVLNNVSFELTTGAHVALVGENGAGKSTIVKLLCGLYRPTSGRVLIDGVDLADINTAEWHKYLSVLQQDFLTYIFTDVKSNVEFGDIANPDDKQRYEVSTRQAEARGFIDKLPHKDTTILNKWMEDEGGEPGTTLSGGQWQRLALARNFYRDSPFVILDEPTSAIDALAEARIFQRIFNASNKKTVLTISHRLSTVKKADEIIVLDDGKIVERGVHAELVKSKGQYFHMFESQF